MKMNIVTVEVDVKPAVHLSPQRTGRLLATSFNGLSPCDFKKSSSSANLPPCILAGKARSLRQSS